MFRTVKGSTKCIDLLKRVKAPAVLSVSGDQNSSAAAILLASWRLVTSSVHGDNTDSFTGGARPISEIPGFRNLPMIGSLLSFISHKDFDWAKGHKIWISAGKQFGKIYQFRFPGQPQGVALLDPDDFQKVYKATTDNPVRMSFNCLKKVRYEEQNNFFNRQAGIVTENNQEWWRVRSQVQTPLMKPKNVVKFISAMDGVALDFINRIRDFQNQFGEMPENFQEEIYKFALESIGTVAFNRRLGCLNPDLASDSEPMQLINSVNTVLGLFLKLELSLQLWRLFPTPTYLKFKRCNDTVLRITVENIKKTIEGLSKKNVASEDDLTLMEILLSNPKLHERDVVTFILDMIFAGIDTTSNTLGFCLYLLARNPKAQETLYKEIASVMPERDSPVTSSHLGRLSYLKACLKETFRMFPLAIGSQRILEKDAVLSGYLVPKGSMVFMLNIVPSREEEYFPRPNEFIPKRWLRDQKMDHIHPYASLPFSQGTRMCIGRRIAEQEIYVLLTRIIQNFKVEYKYKDMDINSNIINMPSEPLKFTFKERR